MSLKPTVEILGDQELIKKFQAMAGDNKKLLDQVAMAGAEVIQKEANRLAPGPYIETKKTRRGLNVEVDIGPIKEKWYYKFFETGAAAHEVTLKNRQALRFWEGGGTVGFLESVHVPAMPAQPFLRPAMDTRWKDAVKAIGAQILASIRKHEESG